MADDFAFQTVRELGEQIRRRKVSAEEVVRSTLERTERVEPRLNSYITVAADQAVSAARAADADIQRGHYIGPLHGIPISIKDHIDTAGIVTTAGSKLFHDRVPKVDAPVVRKLKAAGAIVIGKANLNQFAGGESGWNPDFGKIRNPRFLDYSPGGSSGGSAAQVAAGLVQFSVGSDNGGSIRMPAALCGVVGIKPTFGRVSTDGVNPRSFTSDHVGPLARTVDDAALALDAMSGHAPGSSTTFERPLALLSSTVATDLRGWRIGVDSDYCRIGDEHVLTAFGRALEQLQELGAVLQEISMPAFDEVSDVGNTIFQPEVMLWCDAMIHTYGAEVPPMLREDLGFAQAISACDYLRAQQRRREIQVAFARGIRDVDVTVSPAYFLSLRPFPERSDMALGGYPRLGNYTPTAADAFRYPLPFDFLGLPAVSVPCSITAQGAVGLQIAGRAWEESKVVTVARIYEQATMWHRRAPIPAFS